MVNGKEHWIAWNTQEEYDRALKIIKLRAAHPEKTYVINRENQVVELTEDGEAYFRQLETALLMRLAQKKGIVVSCGGGVIKKQENLELMKKSGTVVWLQADPFTIYKRVRRDNSRPLLAGRMDPDSIRAMMEERRPLYESAADVCVTVDGRSVAAIGQEILRKVSGRASVCESPQ